jgi:Zn-dependent protease with chaperone function
MDFFQNQDVARRKTWMLLGYFVLAVTAMVLALYAVILVVLTGTDSLSRGDGPNWWNPILFVVVTGSVLLVVAMGTLYKTLELRGGGEALAATLGGRRINPDTLDLQERRLLNVVEEMALASGVPVPPVFVLDREEGINAFAAGFTPGDAVIGVNRGTLQMLNRDELQGVMAHEFSHILNGDMRLNLRLIGLLHGILLLAIIGYYLMRVSNGSSSSSRKKGGGQIVLIGLGMFVIGYVGLFFARLIKAAISRQREYLADASAVQFTRNPDGIACALKKIGGLSGGSLLVTPEAETASHMFFGNALRGLWFPGFATHPPLVDRIRRIEPHFDGEFPVVRALEEPAAAAVSERRPFAPLRRPLGQSVSQPSGKQPLTATAFLAAVGTLSTEQVNYVQQLLSTLPEPLRQAVHQTFSARAVILALLLDENAGIRRSQLGTIRERLGAAAADATEQLAPLVAAQGPAGRLPLIELVASTLRQLSSQQYREFRDTTVELASADRRISLFEFALQRSLFARLDRHFARANPATARYLSVNGLKLDVEVLLSAVAHLGTQDPQAREQSFRRAAETMGFEDSLELRKPEDCTVGALSEALDTVQQSAPAIKKRLLHAALLAVSADGQVTVGEAELLRAFGDSLECPLPPLFAGRLGTPVVAEVAGDPPEN